MGGGWRALVKTGRGTGGGVGWWIETNVELKNFKGVRTMQLYGTETHSHPTAYVYSKRLA